MFTKKQIYVNEDKKIKQIKKERIVLVITLICTSVLIWHNNISEYKELMHAKQKSIIIYNRIVEQSSGAMEQGVQNTPEQDGSDAQASREISSQLNTGSEIKDKIANKFGDNAHIAIAIMMAESGGNPDAINTTNSDGSIDRGLFQINSIHQETNLFDIDHNIEVAYTIFQRSGWTAWSTYNNGTYNKFM